MVKKMSKPIPFLSDEQNTLIRELVKTYYGLQKSRIETSNRINMLARDYSLSDEQAKELHDNIDKNLLASESYIRRRLKENVEPVAIYTWLASIKGIGCILSAGLISGIQTASRFDNVSKLWRFCGQAVVDGKAEGKKRGEKIHYSPFMKTLCWKIGESFVKVKGNPSAYYGKWYVHFKEEEDKAHPEPVEVISKSGKKYNNFSKGHLYARAKRKTVKIFLRDFWVVWRRIEGLDTRETYLEGKLGHKCNAPPNEALISAIRKAFTNGD